jgi:hypothetical protein
LLLLFFVLMHEGSSSRMRLVQEAVPQAQLLQLLRFDLLLG